ncbi:MAG: tetratricopeptide repeat protein [Nitrospirae bacterium]|nr:tetratricopeptide repeat protein [Nitrospirota bacterium]
MTGNKERVTYETMAKGFFKFAWIGSMTITDLSGVRGVRITMMFLALLTIAVYGNSLVNKFVWDDEFIIVRDPAVRDPSGAAALLVSPDVVKPYYRPLNRMSYLLDYQLFGMRPAGFHAVNVLVHVLNVLLLYLLGLRLFPAAAPAALAAALFAVHPVNAEAVNFLSARNTLLSLFFVLSSMLVFHQGLTRGSWGRLVSSGLLWFLGLLSKEPAAVAIAVLAVMAFTVPGRAERMQRTKIAALVPHLVFAGLYELLRTHALGAAVGSGDILSGLAGRIADNVYIIPRYLGLVLFPSGLSIMHALPATDPGMMLWVIPVWGAIAVVLWFLLRTGSIPVYFGMLWLAVNYLPISNIIPIPSAPMAERYAYLPAVGLWIIAADRGWALYGKVPAKRALAAAAVVVLLLFGGVTANRNRDWKSDVDLFGSVVRADPESALGHFNLGNALKDAGDLAGAQREWRETLRLDPAHSGAMTQLGSLSAVDGDYRAAERWFRAALDADPRNAMARFNLALIFEKTGRPEEALVQFDLFLKDVPLEYQEYVPRAEEHRALLRNGKGSGGRAAMERGRK